MVFFFSSEGFLFRIYSGGWDEVGLLYWVIGWGNGFFVLRVREF